jgi:sugar-specific transcriptional regulator TrmB
MKKHGGVRSGAGRPKIKGDSVVMRVAAEYKEAVKELISELEALKTENSKVERETHWRYIHLDNSEIKASARVKISVAKY